MSWEESRRKEQVFRKTKLNREVILKTMEDEDGKINIILSLRNNEVRTELILTIEEWESIISFLNKTSEKILEEINKKLGLTAKESSMKPLTKFIKPSKTETAHGHVVKVPAAEVITELKIEPVKVPAAEVITESEQESMEMPAAEAITESEQESMEIPAAEAITASEQEPMEMPAAEAITASEQEPMEMPAAEEITEPENEPMKSPENEIGPELEEPLTAVKIQNELYESANISYHASDIQ